jgi:hypothetical protein
MSNDTLDSPSTDATFEQGETEPRSLRRKARGRVVAVVVLAVAVLGSALVTALTTQVAPVVVVVVAVGVAAWAGRIGWRLAFACVLLAALVGEVLLLWLAPHLGGSLGTDTLVAWTAVGLAHAGLLLTGPPPPIGRRRLTDLVAVASAPVVLGAYFVLSATRGGAPWVSWGMANDAANNTILNRELIVQGGLLKSQGNAAPLATVLYGSFGAQDAGDMSHAELVRHLIITGERAGLLLWGTVGLVAAVIAVAATREQHAGHRLLVGLVAGLLPWTWFGAGYGFAYGFQNAAPGLLCLLLAWLCWREHARHPVAALTGLVLATWATATAWGPEAIFPAVWMVAAVVVERKALRRAGRLLLVPGLTFVAAATYAYVVTLRDVSAQGAALGVDGAHPNFAQTRTVWVLGLLAVLSVVLWRRTLPAVRLGYWLALPAGALSVTSLIRARSALPEWWGYYPIKFTWIAMTAVVLIAFAELQPFWTGIARRLWRGTGVVLAVVAAYAMLFQMSPPLQPVTWRGVLAPVALHDNRAMDAPVTRMFGLMEREPKSIAARFTPEAAGGLAVDSFMNFWMLQMGAANIADPIRNSAYGMNAGDPASLCQGIAFWGGGVTVWTRDPALRGQLADACDPAFDYRVVVLGANGAG